MSRSRGARPRRAAANAVRTVAVCLAAVCTAALGALPAAGATQQGETARHVHGTRHLHGGASIGRAECRSNREAGRITYVSPFGYDASAGIIDVFAARALGYFADMCLDVQIVTNARDGNGLVSSGTAQFTNEGSAADALEAVANGAHFVGVETAGNTSDYALLTRKGIDHLQQLEGKTLGYHAYLPVAISEILHAAHVRVDKVRLVADNNYDPMQLVQGTVDALQAYRSNEVLVLRAAHEPFHLWTLGQFGISGTFNVMVANSEFLAHHRQAAADFMRADLHALDFCLVHRARCVGIESRAAGAAGAEFSMAHEMAVWRLESGLVTRHHLAGKGLGVQTRAEWAPEAKALVSYGIVDEAPSLRESEDTSLVASLYRGERLVWP